MADLLKRHRSPAVFQHLLTCFYIEAYFYFLYFLQPHQEEVCGLEPCHYGSDLHHRDRKHHHRRHRFPIWAKLIIFSLTSIGTAGISVGGYILYQRSVSHSASYGKCQWFLPWCSLYNPLVTRSTTFRLGKNAENPFSLRPYSVVSSFVLHRSIVDGRGWKGMSLDC